MIIFATLQNMTLRLLIIAVFLAACSGNPDDPEQQIRNVLEQVELAAEERNRSDISSHVSDNYYDKHKHTKNNVNNILRVYLLRNQSINIFTKIYSIEFTTPRRAEIKLSAAMAAKGVNLDNETERLKADLHKFTIVMEDESNGDWKVVSAEWERGF